MNFVELRALAIDETFGDCCNSGGVTKLLRHDDSLPKSDKRSVTSVMALGRASRELGPTAYSEGPVFKLERAVIRGEH